MKIEFATGFLLLCRCEFTNSLGLAVRQARGVRVFILLTPLGLLARRS